MMRTVKGEGTRLENGRTQATPLLTALQFVHNEGEQGGEIT